MRLLRLVTGRSGEISSVGGWHAHPTEGVQPGFAALSRGVQKAIGLTPAQITASLVSAQALLATFAALLSIPLGIGLYLAVRSLTSGAVHGAVLAPWWYFALVPVAVAAAVAMTTSLPARLAAQIPVTEAVRYE